MAKYRNLTNDTLAIDLGQFGLVTVEPDGVFDVPDDHPGYFQVGDHGETPLFAAVTAHTKKATTATKED